MTATPREIAEAFSRHRFADAYPHLAPDVRWTAHGVGETVGRDAVVVDAVAHYAQPDGEFLVASCDLYDFAGGLVTAITSYTVAL